MLLLLVIVIISSLLTIVAFFKWKFSYWKRKGLPFIQPRFPLGSIRNPRTSFISNGDEFKLFYDEIKSKKWKHAGIHIFSAPVYIPTDLNLIKNILTKDFYYFDERGRYYNEKDDPISAHLVNLRGEIWKSLRTKFTPTFSPAKMKGMFDSLRECGGALEDVVFKCYTNQEPLEVKSIAKRYASEVIGLCVFGVHFNALKDSNAEILRRTESFIKLDLLEALQAIFVHSFPNISKWLRLRRFDKDAAEYFYNFIKDLVKQRENQQIRRNDFLQLLIDLKNDTREEPITLDQLIAQSAIFFIAGHETSAITIALALYEIARSNVVQEKIRSEIRAVIPSLNSEVSYDDVCKMKYMEQVVNETLRKYPPLAILNRQTSVEYKIPGTDIILEKGTGVIVPLLGLHYDPEYFPNPEEFDPDRFSTENSINIKPFTYLPFGDGPRNCLGLRFGIMETKMALLTILKKYKISINSKTKIPLEFNTGAMRMVREGIWLDVEKLC